MNESPECARAAELLPALWQGELDGELEAGARAWLDDHLESCPECAELAHLWGELGGLPEMKPDTRMRTRFEATLAAFEAERHRGAVGGGWRQWLQPRRLAFAALLLTIGAGAGALGSGWLRARNAPDQAGEIAALRDEVHATNRLVVLSMLQQQSANERLQGVSLSYRVNPSDQTVERALLQSLRYDPSPDVRLAALEALQRDGAAAAAGGNGVAEQLVAAFAEQQSPLVQVAMVDSFLELRAAAARPLLQQVSRDTAYSPEVRQRAAWALARLN